MQKKHRSVGGLGIPILKDYYTVTILDQLRGWFNQSAPKPWCQLEQSWLFPYSPRSLLIDHKVLHTNISIDHPTIHASLHAWSHVKEVTYLKTHSTKISIPLESLHWLIPNISLSLWMNREVLHLKDLMKDDILMSFPVIQDKFNIPSSEFLTYFQISSIYQQLIANNSPIPTPL